MGPHKGCQIMVWHLLWVGQRSKELNLQAHLAPSYLETTLLSRIPHHQLQLFMVPKTEQRCRLWEINYSSCENSTGTIYPNLDPYQSHQIMEVVTSKIVHEFLDISSNLVSPQLSIINVICTVLISGKVSLPEHLFQITKNLQMESKYCIAPLSMDRDNVNRILREELSITEVVVAKNHTILRCDVER